MKTPNTEGTKIHDYVVKLALSRPSISFKFINGNRNAITTPGNGDLFDTITSIYGREISDSLLKIDFTDKVDPNFKISGYISKPNVLKSYRSWQTFIVNGRIISSRIISKAVDEAYKAMIPKSGYPLAILIFDMPSLSVDVNVHPQKTEIRFADENNLYRAVYAAVTQSIDEKTFADANSNDDLQNVAVTPTFSRQNNFSYQRPQNFSQRSRSFNNGIDNTLKILDNYSAKFSNDEIDLPQENFSSETTIDQIATNEKTSTKKITPIGQVDLCYIIAKTDDGLYIVDQHAAHERILFDRICGYTDGIPAQQLLVHQILNFDDQESKLVENNLELFHKLGFTMEPSGENEYRLIEIPADIEISDAENLLREILSNLPPIDESIAAEDQQKAIAKNIRQECLAMTACKAAIKSGMELNFRQMQMILEQLEQTSHPFTCPHGRPTIIKFSSNDLAKMFKRTGF